MLVTCQVVRTPWRSSSDRSGSGSIRGSSTPAPARDACSRLLPPQTHRKMASIMEGPLSKWTNVMKGWQYRWFVLDYNAGLLSYYTVGSSPRFVPAGPRRWGAALVAVGYPPKASCLSGVGNLSWHKEAGFFRDGLLRCPIAALVTNRPANQIVVLFLHFRYYG